MSQSTMSRAAQLSIGDMPSLPLGGANFTRPTPLQKTRSPFTGLITPPESPIQLIPRYEPTGAIRQSVIHIPSETSQGACSSSEVTQKFQGHQTTLVDLDRIREEIYSIVEQAVEQKMADAMGPLRLNINRLDESLHLQQGTFESLKSNFRRENDDMRDQNDTLSRQLDLHYRTIQQHTEAFNSHVKAMNAMIETQSKNIQATTDNVTVATSMVGHLSQVVINLPVAINQVVHDAVQQQTQVAMRDILKAQQQAMLSITAIPQTRESMSSVGDAIPLNCCYHGPEMESVSSAQHDMSFHSHSSHSSTFNTFKSKGSFRYRLGKLFKCGRRN